MQSDMDALRSLVNQQALLYILTSNLGCYIPDITDVHKALSTPSMVVYCFSSGM